MFDTTINLCGNILLKPVKMHFSGNTENIGVLKKSTNFFTGFRIHFFVKIGTLGTLMNRFSQKESEISFFEEKCDFLPKIAFF